MKSIGRGGRTGTDGIRLERRNQIAKIQRSRRVFKSAEGAGPAETRNRQITTKEADDVEEMSSPRTPVTYEIVRRLGDEEMDRPVTSLWWSGVAAGLSISFSLLAQGILQAHLSEASWTPLISSLGYSVGFLMVVLSRQQLFGKCSHGGIAGYGQLCFGRSLETCSSLGHCPICEIWWGTLTAAALCTFTPVLTPELKAAVLDIAGQITNHSWIEMVFRAMASGFLIATMVCLLPSAEAAQFHVIVVHI